MDAQDFRSLQEAYLEVYELDEDWKPVNVPRVKSRMGSLEQGIRQTVSSPDNTPEYARYQRTADVVAQSTSNPNKPFQKPTFDPGGMKIKPGGGVTSSPERNSQWQPFSSRLPVAATKPEKQGPGVPDRLKNQTVPRPGRGPTSKPVAPPAAKPNPRSISGSSAPRPGRGSTSNWMTDRMGEFTSSLNRLSNPNSTAKPQVKPTKSSRGGGSSAQNAGSPSGTRGYQVGGGQGYGISGIKLADSYDLYDIILSHLLDEGYAETQEQAEVIMVNMSEEWRESICENVSSGKSRVTRYVQSKPTGPVTNRELDVSRQKRMDAENDRIKKIGDEAHAAATSKGLSFAEAEFRRKRAELRARKNS